jgi:hypothetical protein
MFSRRGYLLIAEQARTAGRFDDAIDRWSKAASWLHRRRQMQGET